MGISTGCTVALAAVGAFNKQREYLNKTMTESLCRSSCQLVKKLYKPSVEEVCREDGESVQLIWGLNASILPPHSDGIVLGIAQFFVQNEI